MQPMSKRFTVTGLGPACIELQAKPRGTLERFTLRQVDGPAADIDFSLFTRKGACATGTDLHCTGGRVELVRNATDPDKTQFRLPAHGLQVGDQFLVKRTGIDALDYADDQDVHTVTVVVDEDTVDTDTDFPLGGEASQSLSEFLLESQGYWQTVPEYLPLLSPPMYLLLSSALGSGSTYAQNGTLNYANSDEQTLSLRRRAARLYLDLSLAAGDADDAAERIFEVSYLLWPYPED